MSVLIFRAGAQNISWNTFTAPDSSFKFSYPTLWNINQVVQGTLSLAEPNTVKGTLRLVERNLGMDSSGMYRHLETELDRHAGASFKTLGAIRN